MKIQTFQGNSMAEALDRVKKRLGGDAVILHTRTLTKGGVLGVGARTVVEITASRDARALPPAERRAMIRRPGGRFGGDQITRDDTGRRFSRGLQAEGAAMNPPAGGPIEPASRADMAAFTSTLRGEMNQLRAMVREVLDGSAAGRSDPRVPEWPEELREYYTRLIQNEVAAEIARELVTEARDRLNEWKTRMEMRADVGGAAPADPAPGTGQDQRLRELIDEMLVESIERMLPAAEPVQLDDEGGCKCVAFVGPTGVGKTTTIAKLAAHFKLRERKRVGLITTDTYRIAAVEQLRVYAEILNVPLKVVLTPEEMDDALESTSDCDLVLIDTSGRSQRDADRLSELKAFLDAVRAVKADDRAGDAAPTNPGDDVPGSVAGRHVVRGPNGRFRPRSGTKHRGGSLEVHLVLSCAAHPGQMVEAAEKFSSLGVDRVVFAKLDEAVGAGVILNVIRRLNLHMSYLTTGQDVPDDIEVGHRRRIAELVLGRRGGEASPAWPGLRPAPAVDHVA